MQIYRSKQLIEVVGAGRDSVPTCDIFGGVAQPPEVTWVTVPEIAERYGMKLSHVHRLIEERALLARSIDGAVRVPEPFLGEQEPLRSEEHTSELQSLMRSSYA